jgi:hypothetical protein
LNIEKYLIKKLTRREFADALQKGLGRAYLHAIHHGINGVADLILKACLHDQACDPQAENSKAEYLFAIFRNTQYFPDFKKEILTSLKTKRSTWDVQLLFELAYQMAILGDNEARIAIRDRALKIANTGTKSEYSDWLGAGEWIKLAGINGALELAKIYGSRLLKNAEDFVPEDEIFPSEEIKNEFQKVIVDKSRKEPELLAYWEYLDNKGVFKPRTGPFVSTDTIHKRHKEDIRQRYNLGSILNDASKQIDEYGVRYNQFGWAATTEELEIIYEHLLQETDNAVIWRLLKVFSRVVLPRLDKKLFLWAHSTDSQVRRAAIHALSWNTDSQIHALALERIQSKKLSGADSGSIELFVNNYEHADAKLISEALLRNKPGKDDAHSLAWDVIELSNKYHDIALTNALNWSYEKTPCSDCRYRIVKQLDLLGQFNGKILNECQFDGNGDIKDLAHKRKST